MWNGFLKDRRLFALYLVEFNDFLSTEYETPKTLYDIAQVCWALDMYAKIHHKYGRTFRASHRRNLSWQRKFQSFLNVNDLNKRFEYESFLRENGLILMCIMLMVAAVIGTAIHNFTF